jgi:hypothetical protein
MLDGKGAWKGTAISFVVFNVIAILAFIGLSLVGWW